MQESGNAPRHGRREAVLRKDHVLDQLLLVFFLIHVC